MRICAYAREVVVLASVAAAGVARAAAEPVAGRVAAFVEQVSEDRIRSYIAALEGDRHSAPRRAAAAAYVAAQLDSHGYPVVREPVEDSENVIAVLRGAVQPARTFVVGAHFDAVAGSPGADDNASGVAGLLEIATVLARRRFEASIELVAFGLEEAGLKGSRHYASRLASEGRDVVGMISLEMIAYTCRAPGCQSMFSGIPACLEISAWPATFGTFIAAVANQRSSALLAAFVAAANRYVPALRHESAKVAGDGSCFRNTRRSDHAPFWDRGYPALMVTDTADLRNPNYHRPTDRLATLDPAFARQVTQAVLATLLEVARPASDHGLSQVPGRSRSVAPGGGIGDAQRGSASHDLEATIL